MLGNFDDSLWSGYIDAISEDFCPYLRKSVELGLCRFSGYDLRSIDNSEEVAFSVAVLHTEYLRKLRLYEQSKLKKLLIAENLVFRIDREGPIEKEMFFQWIHWALKTAYTESSILFGRFWPQEKEQDRKGRLIPDPPRLFLSIRSNVGVADARFFNIAPQLRDEHFSAKDCGQDVIGKVINEESMLYKLVNDIKQDRVLKRDFLSLAQDGARDQPLRSVIKGSGLSRRW